MGLWCPRAFYSPTVFLASCLAFLACASVSLVSSPVFGETSEPAATATVPLDAWLTLGPVPVPLPAFHDEKGPSGKPVTAEDLLAMELLERPDPWPAAGDTVAWPDGTELTWRDSSADEETRSQEGGWTASWLASYVEADRFVSGTLHVETPGRARVWLDGEQVVEKSAADAPDASETGSASGKVALTPGKHLLWVQRVTETGSASFSARLEVAPSLVAALSVDTSPQRGATIDDLLDVDGVTGLSVSADGTLAAIEMARPTVPSERRQRWVEIRRIADRAVVHTFRGAPEISGFTWGPGGPGRRYAYVSRKDGKATVWVGAMGEDDSGNAGELRAVLRDVEHLGALHWVPDGSSLIYELSEEPPDDDRGVQRMESLQDRWRTWRTKTYLHQVSLDGGAKRRLTAGELSTEYQDMSPDGTRLLVSRTRYAPRERPYSTSELWELPLARTIEGEDPEQEMEPRKLADVTWMNAAEYSPDGETILVRAGPSGFGELGRNVPEGRIANEYDGQLYLLDRASGEARAITRDFDPAIQDAHWSLDGNLYLTAQDGSFVRLYRYRLPSGSFDPLTTGVEVVEEFALAADAPMLIYRGSSATTPERVMSMPLDYLRPVGLKPPPERYDQLTFGRVENRDFVMPETGAKIQGRIYYPPDFDPAREEKWPLFVYYYGGVVPTDRSFTGRYPKNWWAANGYVVYVLQPSGATGYGQEFSSRHVNDWGKTVSQEILHGVETLLEEKPFLDRDGIGCFGGSYGGFMTMLLITRSDLFSAAISHAGISSISSYWGEGWWGYLYSGVATADSFPWNRPEIYIDQSPLFEADEIDTPLLLLHGTADPNVPPGESEQMYTALRLLGKEVEYVKFEGEEHWILEEPKRRAWWHTIMAWLDKHLKGEPEWWEFLWD